MFQDLYPIEHVLDELGRRVSSLQSQNPQELGREMLEEWQNIPKETFAQFVSQWNITYTPS